MQEKGGFQQELEDFVHCVRTRSTPRAAAADVLESHRLVDAIYRRKRWRLSRTASAII
jgi:predicted dehydrogenase